MKPHKHAELIKAWADGAEIECRTNISSGWISADTPRWYEGTEYRLAKKPPPDQIFFTEITIHGVAAWSKERNELIDNVCLIFDGENYKLKKVKIL